MRLKKIHDMDMSKKICLIFTGILLIAVSLTYYITYHVYSNRIETNTKAVMEQSAETMAVALDDTIQTAKQITIAPLFSTELQRTFKAGSKVKPWQQKESRFFLTFLNSMPLSTHAVVFYAQDGTVIFSRIPNLKYQLLESNYIQWKKIAAPYEGTAVVASMEPTGDYCCAILRAVIDTESFEDIGLAAVCISRSDFEKSLGRVKNIPGAKAVVLDSAKNIVYDSSSNKNNTSVKNDIILEKLSEQSGRYSVSINSEIYEGVNVTNKADQYQIIVFSPRRELMKEMKQTQQMLVFIIAGVCVVCFLMIIFMSGRLTLPLKKITELMRRVQNGDFSVRFNSKTNDEVGVLGNNFNLLLERLNKQIDDIVSMNNKKKQMEIDILKSQINPHFMYNTIETIHMMAVDADQPEIEAMSKAFGRIMRYNITAINETTTLGKEISYLEDYIYIQNIRFKNRFRLITDIDDILAECRMIKMLLQPIVENSLMHGFELKALKGTIEICAEPCIDGMIISVKDDGVGIEAEKLEHIRKDINTDASDDNRNIGLKNVNNRIKLYYGDQYGLDIGSENGKGTVVRIHIPIPEDSDEQDSDS